MKTKRGEATKWAKNLLENSSGLSIADLEEYAYGTTGNKLNLWRAQSFLRNLCNQLEKQGEGIGICKRGYYFMARKKDHDEAGSEEQKRIKGSMGWLQSTERGAGAIIKQFPQLPTEVKLGLLELVGKAKDLEILMLKAGMGDK